MKLTKNQIEELISLKNEGISVIELSKKLNVAESTIYYHISSKQKENSIKRALKHYHNLSNEEKRKRRKKHYQYNKAYIKNKYHNDPEFRRRFINYVNESQKRRKLKALEKGNCTRCFKENDSKWKLCLKCREKGRIKHKLNYKKTR